MDVIFDGTPATARSDIAFEHWDGKFLGTNNDSLSFLVLRRFLEHRVRRPR